MKLPFNFLPGSWGLRGSTYERAKAEYELQGYELEIKLANIDYKEKELQEEILKIEFKYKKISEEQYEAALIELMPDGPEKQKKTFENLFRFKHIDELEYNKEIATLNGDPFFHFDAEIVDGSMELQVIYNDLFVQYIKKFGYTDTTEEDAIDAYVRDFGRKISQTEDEELLDYNNELNNNIIHMTPHGDFTSYE